MYCRAYYIQRKYKLKVKDRVKELYRFTGKGRWAKNLAVRPNGNLIVVVLDKPEICELDPRVRLFEPVQLWTSQDSTDRATGIAQIGAKDIYIFTVATKNGVLVHLLKPDDAEEPFKLISRLEGAGQLNGLAVLSSKVLLAADTKLGCISSIDLDIPAEGEELRVVKATTLLKDSTTQGLPVAGLGINGLRYRDGYLYYTNTSKGLLARVPIDPVTAKCNVDEAKILVQGLDLIGIGDFALRPVENEFFVALGFPRSRVMKIILSEEHEPWKAVFGRGMHYPTSVQLSDDEYTIYVTTSGSPMTLGGIDIFEGGKVYAIHL